MFNRQAYLKKRKISCAVSPLLRGLRIGAVADKDTAAV
jgi:hypothetical protein